MINNKYFVIDFDSTFTKVEALDLLGEISLKNHPDRDQILGKIKEITNKGMDGSISFRESLVQRIALLKARKQHIIELIEALRGQISKSFERNKSFFQDYAENIFIISNGFKDFITPIATKMGVKEENIFANTFKFDNDDNIIGFDEDNVLSSNNGKVEQLKSLNLNGDVYVIGDGYTDYEIRAAGLANKFYAFTENIQRSAVTEKADHIAPSLDEFLFHNKMRSSVSYPKNRINVLLLENVHPIAVKLLQEEGYNVEIYPAGMDEDELSDRIRNVSILGIRSKTQLSAKVLENAHRLMAVGAFCIGTNQIDLEACLKKGIAVFNAPFSNTRSVVELAISEIIMLMRNLPDKIGKMHEGHWDKSARNSFEVRGKNLGIIGYGNIGTQLSVLAEALGMNVYYYDVVEKLALGNAKKCDTLEELLAKVDIVSLHVDGRKENENLLGETQFDAMRKGSILLNLSRGHVVDIDALKKNIENGKIVGAGIDVFPQEPKSNSDEFISALRSLPNVILTPHIGGSTLEAQENIGNFVPNKIIDYINSGSTTNSVNFPEIQLPVYSDAHRLIHIHHNVPGVLAAINQVIAKNNINILGQYLKTNETIGYLILAVDKEYDTEVIEDLRNIEHTIRFRVLY